MDEVTLRWRARIGALRGLGLIGLIGFGVLLFITIGSLLTALNNPRDPQPVSIQQLVDGSVRFNQFVSLEGYALYEEGYEEFEGDSVVSTYYLILDEFSGHLIVVKASSRNIDDRVSTYASLTGMTESTSSELKNLIHSDASYYAEAGFVTTPDLYIAEGERPADAGVQAFFTVLLGGGFLLSAVPFFFPTTVFLPKPAPSGKMAMPARKKDTKILATGQFLKLKKIEPEIVRAKGKKKFLDSNANIIPLQGENIMIYIHHVVRYNFIPISKTHWGIFLSPRNTREIQQGLKLGWRDRPAIEIRYRMNENETKTLLLTFEHPLDQANLVKTLRDKGFRVGTGIRTSSI